MSKTIIITEGMLSDIQDMMTMTQFKFKSNVKKFLAGLLEDPVGTDVDAIFKHNGIDKNKLIKTLIDNKAITKKMTIDDHDSEGNPHTAKMIVRYSVPKERFNDRLDSIYDILFPDAQAKINEDGGACACGSCTGGSCTGGATSAESSGEYVQPLFGGVSVRKKKKEVDEATSCSGVGGGSFLSGESYEYDVPAPFGPGNTIHKASDRKTIGGNPYMEELTESIEEYSDSAINTDDFSALPSFAKQVAFCKEKLGFPIGNGSSRMVFRVDDNRVLKLAKNRKGIAQNEVECENSNDYYMGYMFAKVFDYDKNNFTYIVAEEARPPKADDFRRILGVSYNEFWRICMGAEAEYNPRSYSGHKLSQADYELLEENEPLREWYDYITNYQPTSVIEIIRKCNLGVAHRSDGDAIIITDSGFNDNVKDLYQKRVNEGRKKVNKNDKGEVVPETCTCGGKVTLQIKGEPVYICKECGKYYGTMPFPNKKKMNEGAWGSNPLQSDGGLDKRDDVVADVFKYIVNHIEKNGKYESDNNYHWLGVVLWTMNRFKGSYFKSTLEKSGLDKTVKDVVKNLSKDEKFIGGWSKETQNEVRKYINDFEKQYNELKEKYAIDGDKYKHVDDEFEGKGLMDTIAEKDILKEGVTGEDADKSAALYIYNKDKDENWYILCARRSNRKGDEEGGKWNPPMGHLHKGESMKDGALRECLEESGIDFSQYKKEIKIRDHHTWGSNCTLQLGDYVRPEVTIDDFGPKKGDEENSKFIWLPLEDIKSKTWAWSCGENAYKFIPGEIDLIQETVLPRHKKKELNEYGKQDDLHQYINYIISSGKPGKLTTKSNNIEDEYMKANINWLDPADAEWLCERYFDDVIDPNSDDDIEFDACDDIYETPEFYNWCKEFLAGDILGFIELNDDGLIKIERNIEIPSFNKTYRKTSYYTNNYFGELGDYWTYMHNGGHCYATEGRVGPELILCGLCRPEDVNWGETIAVFVANGCEEFELCFNGPIELYQIRTKKGNHTVWQGQLIFNGD